MSSYRSRRYVMRPEVGGPQVDAFATASGRQLVHSSPRAADVDGQMIWTDDAGTSLHYVVDATAGTGYVVVTDADVEQEVIAGLRPWTLDELFAGFDDADELRDRGQFVLRIGLAAPEEFDEGVFTRIGAGLLAAEYQLRYAALWASTYTGYQEFVPVIESQLLGDDAEVVRTRARSVLEAFRACQ